MRACAVTVLSASILAGAGGAAALGEAPGGDHPLAGRFDGSELIGGERALFDEVALITGPFAPLDASERTGPGFTRIEGRSSLLYYLLPAGRSTLEVSRTFEAGLAARNCETMFKCSADSGSCFTSGEAESGYFIGQAIGDPLALPKFDGDYPHNRFGVRGRYLLMRCAAPEGAAYAAFYLGERPEYGASLALRVVEETEAPLGSITFVGEEELSKELAGAGRADVYGVYFDFNADTLRADAKPALDEIASVLGADPALNLKIVGHTDDVGDAAFNLDLSRRRAQAVMRALVEDYGVDEERLAAEGAGESQPVADNDSAQGRAMNRRVELVRL